MNELKRFFYSFVMAGFLFWSALGCWVGGVIGYQELTDEEDQFLGIQPGPFGLVQPLGGTNVLALTPTFRWEDAESEQGYLVQIDSQPSFTAPLIYQSPTLPISQTALDLPAGILAHGVTYYWRVVAVGPEGNTRLSTTSESFMSLDGPWAKSIGKLGVSETGVGVFALSNGGYVIGGGSQVGVYMIKLKADTTIEWKVEHDSPSIDLMGPLAQASDGGFLFGGASNNAGTGSYDAIVGKTTPDGTTLLWQYYFGDTGIIDSANCVLETSDGGVIVAGTTPSYGAGSYDAWVFKLTSTGMVTWQKAYGGLTNERAYSIVETNDGGFLVVGSVDSFGAGGSDFWVLKLDSDGTVLWEQAYGGLNNDAAYRCIETSDGGFLVIGDTSSFGLGTKSIWVVKLASDGSITWQKVYGEAGVDSGNSVMELPGGGYVVVGTTDSFGAGGSDVFVMELSPLGAVVWEKTYGETGSEGGNGVDIAPDGRIVVVGGGNGNALLLKIDPDGSIALPNYGATTTMQVADTVIAPFDTSGLSTHTDTPAIPRVAGFVNPLINQVSQQVP